MRSSIMKSMRTASRAAILAATLAVGAAGASGGAQTAPAVQPASWVLGNVTVVDTRTGRLSPGMSILIEGGTIVRVAPARSLRANGARQVDGRGAFVVPGYNDMHAHPLNPGSPEGGLQLMLANGITGFRQMSGSPELLAARRAGPVTPPDAPALLATPGNILTPPLVAPTAEAAVAEVRRQREQGADFIKVVALPPPVYLAMLDEARRLGIPVAGHLAAQLDVRTASDHGMRAIEHFGPWESILIACSRDEPAIRQEMAAMGPPPPPAIVPGVNPLAAVQRALANPALLATPATLGRTRRVLDTFDPARCRDIARRFVANQTWQVPTLIRLRTMQFGDDARYRNNPDLRYIPNATRQLWESLAQEFGQRITPDQREIFTSLFAAQLRLVKLFDEVGVPMLAGSDYGGGWEVAGFSLHQEFDLLGEAHLSPLRILQMTTIDAARFLGRESTMGSVAAGRNADLVLLGANPVAAVANLHRISGVVRAGHYYAPADLNRMKEEVARRVVGQPRATREQVEAQRLAYHSD
jgi:imidazolonepropionase-like amidohydrolase